ncbi:MAG: alpha/beta hydrolase family protein [Vicinamibacterales bacterium]
MPVASFLGPEYVCAIGVLVVALGGPAATQPASPPNLPRPTGPFPVGTTSFHVVDDTRTEGFADTPEKRQVQVVAWYPAGEGTARKTAPYLRAGLVEGRTFAGLMRRPEDAFDYLARVETHAMVDAPRRQGYRSPVLLFSHGYTAIASSYTALLEDLASHGYTVLSIVHPYEAMAATLADGRVVTMLDTGMQMRQGIRDVLGEWEKEDETMAAVTKAADEAERLRLLRGYLSTLTITGTALERWVKDTALVLNRLPSLPAGPASRMATGLDLSRVGAFGHSMGGVTAAQFCAEDTRCRAGLNLDGIPQYGPMIDTPMNRPFLMVYSAREGRLGASDVIYRRAARPYIRVDVADTLHNDFSDMVLWSGPLAGRRIFGVRPGNDTIAATRQVVREFFDQELRGRPSGLLAGGRVLPGVRVVR